MSQEVYWLVYIDTADDPSRVLSVSKEGAKEQVQEMCYEEGYGELNVGPIGLVDIVQEASGVDTIRKSILSRCGATEETLDLRRNAINIYKLSRRP